MNITFKRYLCIDLRSYTISKTCDLDLDLQGQIGLQTCKIFVLNFQVDLFGILPFHKVFIDNLNIHLSQMDLKTGDLDFQGQIGLEIKKFCVIPCKWDNF